MRILIIGDKNNLAECEANFQGSHQYSLVEGGHEPVPQNDFDVVFDFLPLENSQRFIRYPGAAAVFVNSIQSSLRSIVGDRDLQRHIFGFNGLPTFLQAPCLEISALAQSDLEGLREIMNAIGKEFVLVKDQEGMVTARIIFMIINEAYLTVEEGIATREDVDLAMKMGTNYPYGPFEWSRRIGIKWVYEMLDSLHRSTKDERYEISALLKHEYERDSRGIH